MAEKTQIQVYSFRACGNREIKYRPCNNQAYQGYFVISDKDHRESYFSVSRDVYNPTKGRYIHEVMHKPEELPPGSRIRTLSRSGHKIVVGYWDINKFAVLQVLHPKNEAIPCHFRARLENMDIRIRPGEVRRVKGLTRLKKIITINPIRVLLG